MHVSAPAPLPAPVGMIQVLRTALESQTQLAQELVKVGAEQQVAAQKMAIAGQIIDAYA